LSQVVVVDRLKALVVTEVAVVEQAACLPLLHKQLAHQRKP
jgi:hypothetical protein